MASEAQRMIEIWRARFGEVPAIGDPALIRQVLREIDAEERRTAETVRPAAPPPNRRSHAPAR